MNDNIQVKFDQTNNYIYAIVAGEKKDCYVRQTKDGMAHIELTDWPILMRVFTAICPFLFEDTYHFNKDARDIIKHRSDNLKKQIPTDKKISELTIKRQPMPAPVSVVQPLKPVEQRKPEAQTKTVETPPTSEILEKEQQLSPQPFVENPDPVLLTEVTAITIGEARAVIPKRVMIDNASSYPGFKIPKDKDTYTYYTTEKNILIDGKLNTKRSYVQERLDLHKQIVGDIIGEVQPVPADKKPVVVFLMGPAGAGKTTCINHILDKTKNTFVEVGVDNVMERIPEFKEATNLGQDENGSMITAKDAFKIAKVEAIYLNTDLRRKVQQSRRNMIYDATGQNLNHYLNMIEQTKREGYDVQVYYVDVELDQVKQRAKDRAEVNGRFISDKELDDMYNGSKANFQKIAAQANSASILDNRGKPPPNVATRYKNGMIIEGADYLTNRGF